MLRPGPAASRAVVATALGAVAAAWVVATAQVLGGSPMLLGAAASAVPLAIALAGLVPQPRVATLGASLVALPLGLLTLGRWASLTGRLVPGADSWFVLLLAVATLVSLPLALGAQRVWARAAPAPLTEALGLLAGVALATQLPPWLSGLVAALGLVLAVRGAGPVSVPGRDAAGPLRAVPVALGALTIALAWMWLRPLADPSPTSGLVALAAGGVTATACRSFGPNRGSAAAVLGALGVAGAWVLLWKGPGLARVAMLGAIADGGAVPAAVLISLPTAVAAAFGGAALGLAWGPRRVSALAWLGLPLGGAILLIDAPSAPLVIAGLLSGSALLWSLWKPAQVGGLLVAAACVGVAWLGGRPDPATLSIGTWPLLRSAESVLIDDESRQASVTVLSHVGPAGAVSLRVPADRWDSRRGQAVPGTRATRILELDGLVAESKGRAAEAETLAGHLAGLLAAKRGRVMVLGDDLGRVLGGLVQHDFGVFEVATPSPRAVRVMAEVDPQLRARWLDPRVGLVPLPPGALLATRAPADVIIEVVRAPWADAFSSAPTRQHFDAVADRLTEDGLYVLVLHLGWLQSGGVPAVAAALADRFSHVQAWLPPFGADSLVLVAGSAAVPFSRLSERLAATPGLLDELDATMPEDLASLAIADGPGLVAWHQATGGALPSPTRLGRAILGRPVLHLASLADHLAEAQELWLVEDAAIIEGLAVRRGARESFLRLLGEATSGDMEAVFRRARELQSAGGSLGAATLEPLIEPHIADARRALARARTEGLASASWDDALRYATTARMLAPTSPRPLVVLGEIALGRGKVTTADDHFRQALELDEGHIAAMTGQARAARARGDVGRAIDLLRQATETAPRDWRTWQNLGVLLMQDGRAEEAEESLRRAVLLTDGGEAAPHLALAELMLDGDRAAAALLTAERALGLSDSGYGWYLRGRAHYDLGELDRAEDDFRRAVILDPNLAEARGGVGLIQAQRGELEQAAETFRAVLRLQPNNRAVRENLKRVEEELELRQPEQR